MKEFEGKTAFVTGASRGLGEGISLELIKRGAHVIGTSRSGPSEQLQAYIDRGQASYERADLSASDWEEVTQRLIEKIYSQHGGFEIFVNNAGALSTDYFSHDDPKKLAQEIILDLGVPILMHRHWLGEFNKRHESAKIPELSINICSVSSIYSWAGGTAYQVAKTGLSTFVSSFRVSQRSTHEAGMETKAQLGPVADLNIRTVAIYPDSIATGMIAKAEQGSLYQIKGDLLPADVVVDVVMKSIDRVGSFGKYDDIAILANPTDPATGKRLRGVWAAFLPLDQETQRPAYNLRILQKIASETQLIKGKP